MAKPKKAPKVVDGPEIVETKEQKLLRLSAKRVEKACKAISLIGNLANYNPTDSDIDNMMAALGGTCAGVEARLRGQKRASYAFSLRQHPAQ